MPNNFFLVLCGFFTKKPYEIDQPFVMAFATIVASCLPQTPLFLFRLNHTRQAGGSNGGG